MYYTPVLLKKLRVFRAANPWDRGRLTDWNLNEYGIGLVSGNNVNSSYPASQLGTRLTRTLGIQSRSDGRCHLLPQSLEDLSRNRQAPDERLPALLRQMEPTLERLDFRQNPMDGAMIYYYAMVSAGVMAFCLGTLIYGPDKRFIKPMIWLMICSGYYATAAIGRLVVRARRRRQQKAGLLETLAADGA
jgi:hypothetical protein